MVNSYGAQDMGIEQVGLAVLLQTCTEDVPGLNLGWIN
jgi:hypothetical protein